MEEKLSAKCRNENNSSNTEDTICANNLSSFNKTFLKCLSSSPYHNVSREKFELAMGTYGGKLKSL